MTNVLKAFGQGLERAVIQYNIDLHPRESGGLRQRATEIDAGALSYSKADQSAFELGKSVGIRLYVHYAGYIPLAQNH